MKTRHVLLLDLVGDADLIAAYEAWHRAGAVPGPVVASIRGGGIEDMEIWRRGERLVMIMEAGAAYDPAAKAAADAVNADVQAWEQLMDTMQKRLSDTMEAEKWAPAKRIFALSEQ